MKYILLYIYTLCTQCFLNLYFRGCFICSFIHGPILVTLGEYSVLCHCVWIPAERKKLCLSAVLESSTPRLRILPGH